MIPYKKLVNILILILLAIQLSAQSKETVNFESADSIQITGDIYLSDNQDAPFIILFHQARFSRGEYIEIAPKLNKLGFNCLAIDQRSGSKVNDIINQTYKDAKSKNKGTKYPDAFLDLEASLKYVKTNYSPRKIIIWGSSYSSSLVFILAAKHKEIDGLLSFSPGEYFTFEDKLISEWAKEVECPVFAASSKKEAEKTSVIFKNAGNNRNFQYIPDFSGFHGSKALWESKSGYKEYWKEVKLFLNQFIDNEQQFVMKSLTPNIMVNDVNKTVKYYKTMFDFNLIMSVPEEGKLNWAMMKNGNALIMFQEKESMYNELKSLENKPMGTTISLYIRTTNIEQLYKKMKQTEKIEKELATAHYGAKEFSMIDINGYILTFAEDNK